jgi:ankyrin repeat protein
VDIDRLNLSQARKLAKELLRAPDLDRFRLHHPSAVGRPLKLADCQRVIAREAGFVSWAQLKHTLEQRDSDTAQRAADLVEAAIGGDLPRTLSLIKQFPQLTSHNFAAALVCGNCETAADLLEEDPSLARNTYSTRQLPPLLLCTRTALARKGLQTAPVVPDFEGCVRLLVAAGCDVNQIVPFDPPWQSSSGTPLYWAAGYHGHRDLARVLLELGATPNDGETLYHSVEKGDPELMRLLHPNNRSLSEWSYSFLHLMDYEDTATAECMLQLGVNLAHRHPQSGETPLHWAVKHSRSAKMIELLCRYGADPAAPDGGGVGAFARAARSGNFIAAGAIERSGYREPLDPVSQLMLSAAMNDSAAVEKVVAAHPEVLSQITEHDRTALHRAAEAGRADAVAGLIRYARIDPASVDTSGSTALHHASLYGHVETVRALIEANAPLDLPDRTHNALPIGWACWGSINPPFSRRENELCAVVEMLLAAGSPRPPQDSGSPRIREILRR